MKKTITLLALFTVLLTYAQQKNSLHWEISGKGLSKKSYLYGTMHVNEKISYNLTDAFYQNLSDVDIIATESNPETWLDSYNYIKDYNLTNYGNVYSQFYNAPISKELITTIFTNINIFLKNIVSETSDDNSDYLENTVLDTFIFQTGKKLNKKSVGLEDATQSLVSIINASKSKITEDKDQSLKTKQLKLILKDKEQRQALFEFYREKNIVMLDSIYKLVYPNQVHKALIIDRNEVMVKSLDSILKKGGNIFAAVGAAHLAGKKGILQLLINKGYNVNPVFDVLTNKGKNLKKNIEATFSKPKFIKTSTSDKMVDLLMNEKHYEEANQIYSPDFGNGGLLSLNRIPLNDFLNKKDELFNHKSLDSLFFEKIPGDIIDKKFTQYDGFCKYDIKSKTKTGNNLHFQFYITPLELISTSFTGIGNYVNLYENQIFESIKLKEFKSTWETYIPKKGGFSVSIPYYNCAYGDSNNSISNISLQAFDKNNKSYFFLLEDSTYDLVAFEDPIFQQREIHQKFYDTYAVKFNDIKFSSTPEQLESSAKVGSKTIFLKTIINGEKSYVLGTVNAENKDTRQFFDSFRLTKFKYNSKTKEYIDIAANYKIEVPEKENRSLFIYKKEETKKKKNLFGPQNSSQDFIASSGKKITMAFLKYPKYFQIANMDSLRKLVKNEFLRSENIKGLSDDFKFSLWYDVELAPSKWSELLYGNKTETNEIIEEIENIDSNKNSFSLNSLTSAKKSNQAIKQKVIFNNNGMYLLKTIVDRNYKKDDEFIEKAFESFQPISVEGNLTFTNKLDTFISDAKSKNDTIRSSALSAIEFLQIESKDLTKIINFASTFKFKNTESSEFESLIKKIGEIKSPEAIPFLENLYKKKSIKINTQLAIIEAIASQKTPESYKKILELLEYDLPISENKTAVRNLFYIFNNDVNNSKELFPGVLQFYNNDHYSMPILEFCNALCDAKLASVKKIKQYQKQILTNAKLEYKKSLNNINNEEESIGVAEENETEKITNEGVETPATEVVEAPVAVEGIEDAYVEEGDDANSKLFEYLKLLKQFPSNSSITELIKNAKDLKDPVLNYKLLCLDILNNTADKNEIKNILENTQLAFPLVQFLAENKKMELNILKDEEIAKSAFIKPYNINKKESFNLIEKRIIQKENKSISVYFFEEKSKNYDTNEDEFDIKTIAFVNENEKINIQGYKAYQSHTVADKKDYPQTLENIIYEILNDNHKFLVTQSYAQDDFSDEEY